ncbi:MAG: YqhG family protein [Alicyclobacillus sp.]|nr:YqhG family protein [Alicyclobacillus sp.]
MNSSRTPVPLRTEEERLAFCDQYFRAVGAKTVYSADGYREYELPRDVDKELTDRPFYWLWVEKTGQQAPPTILRLAFRESAVQRENERLYREARAAKEAQGMTELERMYFRAPTAEYITLGSFRLDKIFLSLDGRGRFACVRPRTMTGDEHPVPWLMMNVLVSRRCDLVEQTYLSVGCNLKSGQTVDNFYSALVRLPMDPADPTSCLASAELELADAEQRIRQHIERSVTREPTDWAADAQHRLQAELKQIEMYYGSLLRDAPADEQPLISAELARKKFELKERCQPRIELELRQLALVELPERTVAGFM